MPCHWCEQLGALLIIPSTSDVSVIPPTHQGPEWLKMQRNRVRCALVCYYSRPELPYKVPQVVSRFIETREEPCQPAVKRCVLWITLVFIIRLINSF